MIIDAISDLHGHYPELEGGDLLIVAGDLTSGDTKDELFYFHQWVTKQLYKKTIIIAGNHDNCCAKSYPFYNRPFAVDGVAIIYNDIEYLCDSGTEFTYYDEKFPEEDEGFLPSGKRTLKIWGSPWTKTFEGMNPDCKAFTCDTEEELAEKWKLIPDDVDILITHTPPHTILDGEVIETKWGSKGSCYGSESLFDLLYQKKIKPSLHVFGHIHEGYGYIPMVMDMPKIQFVNASHVNERYEPVNKPVRIVL